AALSKEPPAQASPRCRETYEARRQLRGRVERMRGATSYDVLEVGPEATGEEIQQAWTQLAIRFDPGRLGRLDLGDVAHLAQPVWDQVCKAHTAVHDPQQRVYYNIELAARNDIPAESWARRRDQESAWQAFTRGQEALVAGEAHKAVSFIAQAARVHP